MAWTKIRRRAAAFGDAVRKRTVEELSRLYRLKSRGADLLHWSEPQFNEAFEAHHELLRTWVHGLERALAAAEERHELLARPLPSFEERREVATLWASVLDYFTALDQLRMTWRPFPALSPLKRPVDHARAFALAFGALTAQFRNGLRWIDLTRSNAAADTVFNEPLEQPAVPGGAFAKLKYHLLHVATATRIAAGREYLSWVRPLIASSAASWVIDYLDQALADIADRFRKRDIAANGLTMLKSGGFKAWFPLQKRVARWMGTQRLKKNPVRKIAPHHIADLARRLRPGDILVERRNWNMTNIGLPGFWPHAALYIGTPEQARAEFGDEWFTRQPAGWSKAHSDGEPVSVIEALSPGVIFNSLLTSASADHVGAMRPRLPAAERARALERAFTFLGRPYDFNFDFLTDSAVVCSELVMKAYQPGDGMRGIHLELIPVAGRLACPPNTIVEKFDREYDHAERDFDFVAFFDARERAGLAFESTLADFRASHRRPKWDWRLD